MKETEKPKVSNDILPPKVLNKGTVYNVFLCGDYNDLERDEIFEKEAKLLSTIEGVNIINPLTTREIVLKTEKDEEKSLNLKKAVGFLEWQIEQLKGCDAIHFIVGWERCSTSRVLAQVSELMQIPRFDGSKYSQSLISKRMLSSLKELMYISVFIFFFLASLSIIFAWLKFVF